MTTRTRSNRGARREFALRIFWTLHPICVRCADEHGGAFSLRQLIAFTESLPRREFLRLARG